MAGVKLDRLGLCPDLPGNCGGQGIDDLLEFGIVCRGIDGERSPAKSPTAVGKGIDDGERFPRPDLLSDADSRQFAAAGGVDTQDLEG